MPNVAEMKAEQKRRLTMLLRIKQTKDAELKNSIVDKYITDTIVEMEAEDVAYVQKILDTEK